MRNYFKYLLHMLDFCLLHYFLSSDVEAMTDTLKVSSFHTLFYKTFNKKIKLVLYSIIFRVIPLGLALLYRYYPLTL